MSEIKVNNITSYEGSSGPVLSGITTVSSTGFMTLPRGDTAYRGGRGRGLFGGGEPTINTIDYITIATTGNASDFGDLTQPALNTSGNSNAVRAVIAMGTGPSQPAGIGINTLEYITIATLGNSKDFGDATTALRSRGCCSSSTRGVFAGGSDPGSNVMDYVQIPSLGDAHDFGDLDRNSESPGSCSNGHGGL